jgi:hypothetical protein
VSGLNDDVTGASGEVVAHGSAGSAWASGSAFGPTGQQATYGVYGANGVNAKPNTCVFGGYMVVP